LPAVLDRSRAEARVAALPPLLAEAEAAGQDWLSAQERDRLGAMRSRRRRQQFLAGHWLLRRLAADCLGGVPADYVLEANAAGAPRLRALRDDSTHAASISHSGDWVAVALAPFAIGIDIECRDKPRDWLVLAAACCTAPQVATLRELPEGERASLFHRLWTSKEAVGKRDGQGLRLELARRQSLQACAAGEAEVLCWEFDGLSLALAGNAGVAVRVAGLPGATRASGWRIETAD
jgi:4'-phosphopantetheinyl transferase